MVNAISPKRVKPNRVGVANANVRIQKSGRFSTLASLQHSL